MPELVDLEAPAPEKLWLRCADTAANRAELARVAALQDKEQGYPRRGVQADGRDPPPGVPAMTERWASVEPADEEGKQIHLRAAPGLTSESKLPHLSASEEAELRDAYARLASDSLTAATLDP